MEAQFTVHSCTGCQMVVRKWQPAKPATGIVLILHGMAEHSARYDDFAYWLNLQGLVVYAPDQHGHGQTAGSIEKLGLLEGKKGWYKMLEDLNNLQQHAQTEHPNLSLFILGHSMGSMVVRHYLQQYPEHETTGAIIISTASDQGALRLAGVGMSRLLSRIFGANSPSPLMNFMSFGAYNKPFAPNRTAFDWLSRDNENVDKYVADPYCGTVFSLGFWDGILSAMGDFLSPQRIKQGTKKMPMLWLTGTMDPVGDFGKGVPKLVEQYKQLGFANIQLNSYTDARHELLNETNRSEIYADITDWIKQNTPTA